MEHVVDQRLLVGKRHLAKAEIGLFSMRLSHVLPAADHSAAGGGRYKGLSSGARRGGRFAEATKTQHGDRVWRVVPTFRIFSLEKAREFYLDFLGFKIDWEHRFDPTAPVYMQVSRGKALRFISANTTATARRARSPMST